MLRGETLSEAEGSKHSSNVVCLHERLTGGAHGDTDRMMKAAMLGSQSKMLENSEGGRRVVMVSIEWSTEDQVLGLSSPVQTGHGENRWNCVEYCLDILA